MPKYLYLLIAFIISLSILQSCSKNNDTPQTYPYTLTLKSIVAKTGLKLYINKAQVTNLSVQNKFIGSQSSLFGVQNTYQNQAYFNNKVVFTAKDTITFGDSKNKFILTKTDEQFLLTSVTASLWDKYDVVLTLLKNYLIKPLDFGTGYRYLVFNVIPATGNYKKLQIPLISYKLKNQSDGYYYSSYGSTYNEFNESYIKNQGVNDTLAVQEFILTFN